MIHGMSVYVCQVAALTKTGEEFCQKDEKKFSLRSTTSSSQQRLIIIECDILNTLKGFVIKFFAVC